MLKSVTVTTRHRRKCCPYIGLQVPNWVILVSVISPSPPTPLQRLAHALSLTAHVLRLIVLAKMTVGDQSCMRRTKI
jgi:hypothetical protein